VVALLATFGENLTNTGQSASAILMRQDYYSTIANVVSLSARDDPQKRRAIYALARSELRRQLERRRANAPVKAHEMSTLDAAIEKVECEFAQSRSSAANAPATFPLSVEILPPEWQPPPPSGWQDPTQYQPEVEHTRHSRRRLFTSALLVTGAAMLVGVTYLVAERGLHDDAVSTTNAAAKMADERTEPETPTPENYGVYAIAGGRLTELNPLAIKVPERRTYIPGTIVSQSETKRLPDGRLQFIVFRADIAKNAPEKVVVRPVAKIARTSEGAGDDKSAEAWSVGETSYQMNVGPVDGNPAMIVIRPPVASFSFPVGRYVLVVKSTAYDFTVASPIAE
jgi:hypothetical protein